MQKPVQKPVSSPGTQKVAKKNTHLCNEQGDDAERKMQYAMCPFGESLKLILATVRPSLFSGSNRQLLIATGF